LQAWLTEATEGTATDGVAPSATTPGPPARPRRNRIVLALVAVVALAGATTAGVAWSRSDTEHHDSAKPAALKVDASWYPLETCFGDTSRAGTAMDREGRALASLRSDHDIAFDPDGGRWDTGLAKLTLTPTGKQPVQVTDMTLKADPKEAPNWVLIPPPTACERPAGRTRHYVLHLDPPWKLSVAGWVRGQPPRPQFTVMPGSSATLAVDVLGCGTNQVWQLQVTYYLPEQGRHEYHVLTPPLRLYSGATGHTKAYAGTLDAPSSINKRPHAAPCPR
jgi:hypothetical protein